MKAAIIINILANVAFVLYALFIYKHRAFIRKYLKGLIVMASLFILILVWYYWKRFM